MDNSRQSIIDHLEELRFRILWSLLAIVIAFFPAFAVAPMALDALIAFACPAGVKLSYIRPMELFFTQLEVGFVFAVLFSLPVTSYHLWRFIAPALYRHEKRIIQQLALASSLLFLLGVAFAICFVFPAIMRFSIGMQTEQIKPELIIDSFVSLAVSLSLGFGIMFQLPIVVCVLVALGIVKLESMKKMRPLVVTIIFVLAAILTPPDVISQLTLGIPTWMLFEGSLLFCRRLDRKRQERERKQQEEERLEDLRFQEELEQNQRSNPPPQTETSADDSQQDAPTTPPEDSSSDSTPDDFYDYTFTSPSAPRRIRNTTPGRHGGRRARTSRFSS